jgi:hypothetical protein
LGRVDHDPIVACSQPGRIGSGDTQADSERSHQGTPSAQRAALERKPQDECLRSGACLENEADPGGTPPVVLAQGGTKAHWNYCNTRRIRQSPLRRPHR